MSIFRRIFKIGQANINKTIDGLEKPEVMLEQAIRDQQKRIGDVKKSVQSVIATERQTKALLDREQENKTIWEQKATAALQAGREDLATKALVRSEEHEKKAASLKPQWEMQRSEIEKLKSSIRQMEDELADLKRNKNIIIAQSKAAQAKKEIYEAKAKIGKNKTTDLIDRMKAKAERTSYEAAAAEEIAEEAAGDSLEKEFKDIGDNIAGQSVQDKLAALKAKL
ncbi:MAG: PspA/IM30 family protein [Deltaproteobacteria bacterium]|nr:PspA/IM30 family protein [Deltaproteobacteria bacterium]